MSQSHWRIIAAKIISAIIGMKNVKKLSAEELKALKKEISEAYPFGERARHPYKIWCSEVQFQLGAKKPVPMEEMKDGLFA